MPYSTESTNRLLARHVQMKRIKRSGMARNQMIQDILHIPAHPQHEEYVKASKEVQFYQKDKINFMLREYVTVKRMK